MIYICRVVENPLVLDGTIRGLAPEEKFSLVRPSSVLNPTWKKKNPLTFKFKSVPNYE